jgi:hypothetical protein
LNDHNCYLLCFTIEQLKHLDQVKNLDQTKGRGPEQNEATVNANIENFEMSFEDSLSCSKHLENLEKIRCTKGLVSITLPVDSKKIVSVKSSLS